MKIFRKIIMPGLVIGCFALSAIAQTNRAVETELLIHLANIKKYSSRGGSGSLDALEKENVVLQGKLLKYGRRPAILKYRFPALSQKMFIATSRDGKFRIYSWDNETGGTMRDFENVFQYQAQDGSIRTFVDPKTVEGDSRGFYHQIFQSDTPAGRVYLANSSFMASTSLARQDLSAFRIVGTKLDTGVKVIKTRTGLKSSVGFSYDLFSVVNRPERPIKLFYYDEASKTFRFPIVIQDRKTPQGRVTSRFIIYRFNGNEFVRVD